MHSPAPGAVAFATLHALCTMVIIAGCAAQSSTPDHVDRSAACQHQPAVLQRSVHLASTSASHLGSTALQPQRGSTSCQLRARPASAKWPFAGGLYWRQPFVQMHAQHRHPSSCLLRAGLFAKCMGITAVDRSAWREQQADAPNQLASYSKLATRVDQHVIVHQDRRCLFSKLTAKRTLGPDSR